MKLLESIRRTATSLKERFGLSAPKERYFEYVPHLDTNVDYILDGVDFSEFRTLARAADSGDIATTLRLFDEMEQRDHRLRSVACTRRLALTGLEWDVISAADQHESTVDRTLADEAASFVRESLSKNDRFDRALEHFAEAIGPNLRVAELVWSGGTLADVVPIPSWRLTTDGRNPAIRIRTKEQPSIGVEPVPGKFVVHVPDSRADSTFSYALNNAIAVIYLVRWAALADWAQFCQTFGMPVRVARYQPKSSNEEKSEALKMLRSMGSHAYALISKNVDFEMKEAVNRGASPYQALIDYCDRGITIAFLGGSLTVDTTGQTGTYAAGAVHNDVRRDLRDDDIRKEARTIREQIIAPMVAYGFPGRDAPVPYFTRLVPEVEDRISEAELIRKATQEIGLNVEESYVYDRLSIPTPVLNKQTGEPANRVVKRIAPAAPFGGASSPP